MKRFYKTALLVSLLGISNLSCGELDDARAIHETWRMGQESLQPRGAGNLSENGRNYFKEPPVRCAVGGVAVAVGILAVGAIIWYRSRKNAAPGGGAPGAAAVSDNEDPPPARRVPAAPLLAPDVAPAPVEAPAAVRNLLHIAASNGNIEEVRRLIGEKNIPINSKDPRECTPLYLAAWMENAEVVRMLIDANANIEARNDDGWTPLHVAAWLNNIGIVRMLINARANKNVQDNDGFTPYDRAPYKNLQLKRLLA
ncbi:MAG: ankyrin repeat domain-containing protein [Holosporales bacterium]|jgi:hypothetical protein|nr:ankyrin repeat domain-containing protein [Holosporales bacterium]